MRIISGKFKGRRLEYDINITLRPTKDRVKEGVFNMIGEQCINKHCLDLFAGTGALGLEAVSRGAKHVDFVDVNTRLLSKNVEVCDDQDSFSIFRMPALSFLKKRAQTYFIIFIDPPWVNRDFYASTLKAISDFGILEPNGLIICEHAKEVDLGSFFNVYKQKKYGTTLISLLRKHT